MTAAATARPSFAHASEAELARILDFYEVRWRYEPDTYPIGWNLDGDVVESFSPDFYLPDLELYVELTTLKQKLVRKKNRKLRRLRELYPDIRIKLFYGRDFRMLMLKFGRMALLDDLTGTTGQSTPPRMHAPAPAPVPGVAAGRTGGSYPVGGGAGADTPDPADTPGPADPAGPADEADPADTSRRVVTAGEPGASPALPTARCRRRGRRRRRTPETAAALQGGQPVAAAHDPGTA